MDETFQLRAKRMLGPRQPAPLDYDVLSATLIAQQAESPAARAQGRFDRAVVVEAGPELLTETLLAGPDWEEAATARHGCFQPCRSQAPEDNAVNQDHRDIYLGILAFLQRSPAKGWRRRRAGEPKACLV